MADTEKTKLGITKFLTAYFKYFVKLIYANVIFAVPLVLFFTLFYFLGQAINFTNIIILCLTVIPVMPFYAGITLVTRNMVRGDDYIPVFTTFLKGVKENGLRFLLHGVVLYCAILFSYFSISLYGNIARQNPMFYAVMIICIIVSILFLFLFFNLPLMTVTFDISIKDTYKNCALMTFGEIKNNFLAVLGVFLLGVFCLSLLIFSSTDLWVIVLTILFVVCLIPGSMSFIINYAEYKDMMNLLVSKEQKKQEIEREILYKKNPNLKKQDEARKFRDDFSDLEIDESKDGDEYIFHNGKMIKRSVLIKQLKAAGEVINEKEEK